MSVAKSDRNHRRIHKNFEDAVNKGIKRATGPLKKVVSARVQDQQVTVRNGKISAYRVNLKMTFILKN